jgi:porphyrinogen peroxidase
MTETGGPVTVGAGQRAVPGPRPAFAAPEPQPVLGSLTAAAIFLVVSVKAGGEPAVRDLLPDLAGLSRSVGSRIPEGGLTCVAGLGSTAWDRLFSGPRPAELHPFRELAGAKYSAIATPGDLLFHLRARHMDLCFELATQIMDRLAGWVTIDDEVHGFRYFDERDLLGFVDGTENPGARTAVAAALVGADDPAFAGGSYVIVQKYLHDLRAWSALPVEEQERVIGRTKLSNIELPDGVKPANSHVALNTITGPDGAQRQIVRFNIAFGSAGRGEFGTYFISYAATPSVTEHMLANMFVGNPPDNYDRILDYSTAVTGGLFFAPSADFLDNLPGPPERAAAPVHGTAAAQAAAPPPRGSLSPGDPPPGGPLRIGGLKGKAWRDHALRATPPHIADGEFASAAVFGRHF